MKAQYPGICKATGTPYPAGAEIEKGPYGWQIKGAQAPDRTVGPNELYIAKGEGYGGEPYRVGQTFFHGMDWAYVTVRAAWSEYYREDGMSFGVGDESGHIYFAICRPATAEEQAPLEAEWERQQERQRIRRDFERLLNTADGVYEFAPDGKEIQLIGQWIKIGQGFTIYGGGEEALIAADGQSVWRVRGNGADGDNWSLSNTSHGIGYRFEATPERLAALAALATLA